MTSQNYATSRIKEALRQTGNNSTQARKLVQQWVMQDQRLLYELARPHMKGIIAHAISRAEQEKDAPAQESPDFPEAPADDVDSFGRDLLRALQGNSLRFGQEEGRTPRPSKTGASKQHIDAINKMTGRNTE